MTFCHPNLGITRFIISTTHNSHNIEHEKENWRTKTNTSKIKKCNKCTSISNLPISSMSVVVRTSYSSPYQSYNCVQITNGLGDKNSGVAEMGDRGHNRHGPKREGAAVSVSRRAGTPSNTMWPGPRSASVPSGVFIHPAVWPQRAWVENWGGCAPLFRGS